MKSLTFLILPFSVAMGCFGYNSYGSMIYWLSRSLPIFLVQLAVSGKIESIGLQWVQIGLTYFCGDNNIQHGPGRKDCKHWIIFPSRLFEIFGCGPGGLN